ncbi:MAG: dihydrofolate reductase family protein, partial [Thermoplasmata archaeon]|nr:dihydrofolate reductase family protein [Thermoplasmata archaeon]
VGINTVLADDPKLTVKEEYVTNPTNPLRVILDSKCRTPGGAKVLDGKAPTLIAALKEYAREIQNAEVIPIEEAEVNIGSEECRLNLTQLLEILHAKGIKKLLVEGGETVIWSFLHERLADELWVFVGSIVIGGTHSPTLAGGEGAKSFEDIISLKLLSAEKLGDGVLLHYSLSK